MPKSVAELLKRTLKASLTLSGAYHMRRRLDRARQPGGRLIVIVYHNLSDGTEYAGEAPHPRKIRPELTASMLDTHLRVLKEESDVVSLEEAVLRLQQDGPQQVLSAVTFDDGYSSFARLAHPILRRHNVPATVFLPTRFIGSDTGFWWDRLGQIAYHHICQSTNLTAMAPSLGKGRLEHFKKALMDTREAALFLSSLERYLLNMPAEKRHAIIEDLQNLMPDEAQASLKPEKVLTWDEVRVLAKEGVSFGSHTASHVNLRFATPDEAEDELQESQDTLKRELGSPGVCLAYPYGGDVEHYRTLRAILTNHGIRIARTTHIGCNLPSTDPLSLWGTHMSLEHSPAMVRRHVLLSYLERSTR